MMWNARLNASCKPAKPGQANLQLGVLHTDHICVIKGMMLNAIKARKPLNDFKYIYLK